MWPGFKYSIVAIVLLGSHSDGNMNTNTHHEALRRERVGQGRVISPQEPQRGGGKKKIESHKYFKSEFVKYLLAQHGPI